VNSERWKIVGRKAFKKLYPGQNTMKRVPVIYRRGRNTPSVAGIPRLILPVRRRISSRPQNQDIYRRIRWDRGFELTVEECFGL
jgi:hypothetical protein